MQGQRSVRDRRLVAVLLTTLVLAAPAAVLRLACVGNTCAALGQTAPRSAPFCSLPGRIQDLVAAGFREGRSPDVLGVAREGLRIDGGTDRWSQTTDVAWPSLSSDPSVPIVFSGTGVDVRATVDPGTTLDQVAPTLAEAIRFDRPFANVRSGTALAGVANGPAPRLVVEIALKGVGTGDVSDAAAWPNLSRLLRQGAGTLEGSTGSLPLDPSATLTTIGTGGLPDEHGITGTLVRNEDGEVVRAWGEGSPLSIIAALPEDLEEALRQRPKVGLVATSTSDLGLIGRGWYPHSDRDDVRIAEIPTDAVGAAKRLLAGGFGRDRVPDVLAVVLEGADDGTDTAIGSIVRAASIASGGSSLVVVAGTGSTREPTTGDRLSTDELLGTIGKVDDQAPRIVDAAVPGGMFLDPRQLTESGLTGQVVRDALLESDGPDGDALMADSFQSFAVSFARYC